MKHTIKILLGVGLVAPLAAPVFAANTPAVEIKRNISYFEGKNADPVRHKLDLYLPEGKKGFPVMVLVHGGAWVCGDKTFFGRGDDIGQGFAKLGIGVVMPNYRLAPDVSHGDQAHDVARALAWTLKNIARYGGSAENVFLGGHSAGGHLATLIATDETYLKEEGVKASVLKGVIGVSGVYQFPELNLSLPGAGKMELKLNPLALLSGDEKDRREMSPLSHVRAGLPPFLLIYADHDLPLLPQMAKEFARALKDSRCDAETMQVEERDHESVMFDAKTAEDPVTKAMMKFITTHASMGR